MEDGDRTLVLVGTAAPVTVAVVTTETIVAEVAVGAAVSTVVDITGDTVAEGLIRLLVEMEARDGETEVRIVD